MTFGVDLMVHEILKKENTHNTEYNCFFLIQQIVKVVINT